MEINEDENGWGSVKGGCVLMVGGQRKERNMWSNRGLPDDAAAAGK